METVEIHLGKPYAPVGAKCVYCGKPATRSATMEGSMLTPDGVKHSFTKEGTQIYFCDDHGILIKEVKE